MFRLRFAALNMTNTFAIIGGSPPARNLVNDRNPQDRISIRLLANDLRIISSLERTIVFGEDQRQTSLLHTHSSALKEPAAGCPILHFFLVKGGRPRTFIRESGYRILRAGGPTPGRLAPPQVA